MAAMLVSDDVALSQDLHKQGGYLEFRTYSPGAEEPEGQALTDLHRCFRGIPLHWVATDRSPAR